MSDNVRDFFVGLGFKVDGSSQQTFTDALNKATLRAKLLGDGIEAAARAIAHAVAEMSKDFERLYYQSQRTNASVAGIKALSYALTQFGTSGDNAAASVASFGKAVATNPSGESLLKTLGVQTRTASGQLRDTTTLMGEFGQALKRYPVYVREQYANMLGVDYETMRALTDQPEKLRAAGAEQRRYAAMIGLNQDEAAEKGKNFMQGLRRLQMVISLVAEKILSDLAPALQKFVDGITEWIAKNPDQIAATMEAIAKGAVAFAEALFAIARELAPVLVKFGEFSAALTGHGSVQGAMEVLAAFMVGSWVVRILAAFGAVSVGWAGLLLALGVGGAAAAIYATTGGAQASTAPGGGTSSTGGGSPSLWERAKSAFGFGGGRGGSPNAGTGIGRRGARASADDSGLREGSGGGRPARGALGKNQQEAYRAGIEAGLSPTASRALVANMSGEALDRPGIRNWDVKQWARGIVQWDPSRSEAIKQKFGKYPNELSVAEQTKAAVWEIETNPRFAATKRALKDPNATAAQMLGPLVRNYENPADHGAALATRMEHLRRFRPDDAKPDVTASGKPVGDKPAPVAPPVGATASVPRMVGMGMPSMTVNPPSPEKIDSAAKALGKANNTPKALAPDAAPPLGAGENGGSTTNTIKVREKTTMNFEGEDSKSTAGMVLHGQAELGKKSVRGIQRAVA